MKLFFKTIRGKIILLTAIITFIITIVTTSICFVVFQNFLRKYQIQSAEYNLKTAADQISADMKDTLLLSKWLCSNHEMLRYLETFDEKSELSISSKQDNQLKALALSSYNRMKEEFYSTRSKEHIIRVLISTNNQRNFLQIMASGHSNHSQAPNIITANEFFDLLYLADHYEWPGIIQDPLTNKEEQPIIPIIRPVYNQHNSDTLGWIYLSVSPTIITSHLKTYPLADDSTIFLTINERTYAINNQRLEEIQPAYDVLSSFYEDTLNSESTAHSIRTGNGKKQTLVTVPIGIDGWYLSEILSHRQLNSQRSVYISLIAGICFLILSLGMILVILMNYMISRPVANIRRKIDAISEGDFSDDPTIEWEHELGEIGRGINRLVQNVVSLMDRRIADEKQKKDLEYQILQSQINPHFLYNTLNSIKWMATIQNASGIAEMTTALARLMKNIAKGNSTLIPLKEELDLVNDYFLIQQYRYGGTIQLNCQMQSDDLKQCSIHRFTLQPLIENALFHGIEPKGTNGHIFIQVEKIEKSDHADLQISITDDGIGMTTEMIQQIMLNPSRQKSDFFKQIGIYNVNQRIQYDFGTQYGVKITSEPGVFTTMTILIPCQKDN